MIDVIVPVYDGVEQTRRVLDSLRRTVPRGQAEVVVVDDATPRPEIARELDRLASAGEITLVRHAANRGFVHSVNAGMALHPDRDVLLLNSDTEVANDWLERLAAAAASAGDIATVTPFSNNATICSYPYEGWEGGVPGTLGLEALDRLAAQANRGRTADIPTAVGFCMFIRRKCLERVGAFDADRFGRGYGEENDFCMRAAEAGWRHVLAADVFVFHEGGVSFSGDRAALLQSANAALLEAHPQYGRIVEEFIARDPLSGLRDALDAARCACGAEEEREVLRERAMERGHTRARMGRQIAEQQDLVARLRQGLAQAEGIVAGRSAKVAMLEQALEERDAALREVHAEIARLHEGLDRASALAVERLEELQRIRQFWMWRFYWRAMRLASGGAGKDG